ncbi:MAG: LSU ribosomal protein L1p (L10Ae) [uncultured Thermomicrobiales bacterium]|uniref:Large ribosomal subunit protein uL1 n=1 Tax=uncultured Thermomicrobiales bacterium TaxID=1645740 RepID=A0A6J4UWT2_9BACT|nr:MAG: LSU ribosomal protein L1p (L10Ae) [uncultured Thermomicrobiales bacterium]
MPQHGKKYADALKKIEPERLYTPDEAITLVKELAFAGFDETVEIHARLGIDPRQADQIVRTTALLPHGTGKVVRVLVFATGEAERAALDAGADYAGVDEYVQQIQGGWLEFDAAVAMADQMGKVGGLGRILGRRGLMPNPRSGTVIRNPEDLPNVIRELKGGRVEFRNDRTGIVHTTVGRKSFTDEQLRDNLYAVIDSIQRAKPASTKGVYCRTLTLATSMSPGVPLDVALTLANATTSAA